MEEREKEEEQGFKVRDRRRFDSDGNSRPEDEASGPQAAQIDGNKEVQSKAAKFSEESGTTKPEINFSSFVMSLATQALMQLGEMPSPEGYNIPRDKVAAKNTIEILDMLKVKTSGNLDVQEGQLLEDILHSLHVSYVRAV